MAKTIFPGLNRSNVSLGTSKIWFSDRGYSLSPLGDAQKSTAKDLWDTIEKLYSKRLNTTRLYTLRKQVHDCKQGTLDVTSYFNKLSLVCQEIDLCRETVWVLRMMAYETLFLPDGILDPLLMLVRRTTGNQSLSMSIPRNSGTLRINVGNFMVVLQKNSPSPPSIVGAITKLGMPQSLSLISGDGKNPWILDLGATDHLAVQKKENATLVKDFCLISLTTLTFKVVAKVLSECLKQVMVAIIRPLQSAFIEGSSIWTSWIMGCLRSPKFSIFINGKPRGRITASRGLINFKRWGLDLGGIGIHNTALLAKWGWRFSKEESAFGGK
ncbi:UBN2_3 domain-containing protein [Cucumis melo var. makuwa]|uniref:UBN2_3 domain-containing protein n=1 Tax=Cucumis melo var. makuwa TaxID=1194695 RepID=A0A5A7SSV5_CUCMM|nr:UBN2_3 domain-containing protein [Cucumis melo var. makuwa]TYK04634.1 UBN2_3 domain-containing protein [Cucumis melo var. makuwa]